MNNEVKRFKVVNVLLVTFVLMLIVSVGLMLCQ
ncbi:peptidase, partial [Acinetobacter baumannii]